MFLQSPHFCLPVVPARGGAEVALKIYIRPFSSIELACAVRQPSPCVRALCETGVLFHMSHLKLHFALRTSHCSLHTPHYTLHTPHFTLHSWDSTLHTSHSTRHTPHFTRHTALFALQTSHFTVHTSHFTVHTSHFSLLTAFFTLQKLHTSHCTLHAPHFTLHSSHSTLHLIWALLTLSQLISSHLISSHMSSKLSWITSQYYYQSLSQPWCTHSNTIYDLQLQKTIVLRMQPLHQATLTQPLYNAICRDWVAKHNRTMRLCATASEIAAPKPDGSRRQSRKKTILKHFLKGIFKGKLLAPKLRKSADKSLSQPWCAHSNTIYDLQLQKTIVLRMQPLHQATLTQPLYNAICRDWVAKHNRTMRNGVGNCSSKTGWISTPKQKKDDFEALFKRMFRRKITSAKIAKICWQITIAAWMQPL